MQFLTNLDKLLKINHMSRTDLGREIGVSASTINSWFKRSTGGVTLDTLAAISKYFNVTIDALVNSEDIEKDIIPKTIESPFTNAEIEQIKRLLAYFEMINTLNGGDNEKRSDILEKIEK